MSPVVSKVFGVLTLSMIASSLSVAGERVGNGGVGVVCRDPRGNILSAQMLDLFEGESQYHLTYSAAPGIDLDTLVNLAQLQMTSNQKFLLDFQSEVSKVKSKITFLPHSVGLTPTDDAFPIITKKGCAFEQVANYAADDNIYVDKDIYDRLDLINQAALYVHETVYSIARTNVGDTNSIRARKLTAHVLAKSPDSGVVRQLMEQLVAPPKPQWPKAFMDIQAGSYTDDQGELCSFVIDKNEMTGRLSLTWVNRGSHSCNAAGRTVELKCAYSSCSVPFGQLGSASGYGKCQGKDMSGWDKVLTIKPLNSTMIQYEIDANEPTTGTGCFLTRRAYYR